MEAVQITPDTPVAPATKTVEGEVTQNGSFASIQATPTEAPKETPKVTEGVPQKFLKADGSVDTDALLKSYQELEKKQSAPAPKVEAPKVETQLEVTQEVAELLQRDLSAGAITDATYETLKGKGISKQVVDSYVEGQRALATAYNTSLESHVGGKENLQSLLKWAETGLTASEISTANQVLSSGSADQAKLVLDGLRSRYVAANGTEPTFVSGNSAPSVAGVKAYESMQQVVAVVNSKEYKTDPAVREQHRRRLSVTDFNVKSY